MRAHSSHRSHVVQIHSATESFVLEKLANSRSQRRELRGQLDRFGNPPRIVSDQLLRCLWLGNLVISLNDFLESNNVVTFVAEGFVVGVIGAERQEHGLERHHIE